jgi:ATP-dependent DNA helicase DinG
MTVRRFFSQNGPLAQHHPGYEFRKGQLDMALAVEEALEGRRHQIVEAGTGTGKTLAYLVPAILSGKRVIISTGTKNLQEQLFLKDIPFLQQFFPDIRACYMKGRNNYACRQKIYDAEREPILSGLEEVSDFAVIRDWEKSTETGDRAEIAGLSDHASVWAKVDARSDMCTGEQCKQFERCFVTLTRQQAQLSDIIIVNHHLFFADLAVKQGEYGGVLPDYAAVVFDEAHELEDVAGQYFGLSVSTHQIEDLRRDVMATARRKDLLSADLEHLLTLLVDYADRFFLAFQQQEGRSGFNRHAEFLEDHGDRYHGLLNSLELLHTHLSLIKNAPEEFVPLHRRGVELHDRLRQWMESGDQRYVYWVEKRGRGVYLQATPIDVSGIVREMLFDQVNVAVLTSATLAVEQRFDFVRERLGLQDARELIVPSHFNYAEQALLYIPKGLPDVRSPGYQAAAAKEVLELLRHSRGRAFVLFTSYAQMRATHERVVPELDFPTLMQGTMPQRLLMRQFRETPHCVLFATSAFWQGVDVQGDALSCVIIDKLPFAVPSDPVVDARIRAIRERGGNPFNEYQVPQAAIALKQGFGRLIRSRNDRGVLALLDNRIIRQRYGRIFFDSLPPYRLTHDPADVEAFFEHV